MKTKKMSLVNIQGKLSRAEMKKIMAGSGSCAVGQSCWQPQTSSQGQCMPSGYGCYCVSQPGNFGAYSFDCTGYWA